MRKIIFAMALGALLLPDYGFTLGLGEIEVSTSLNQELNAEIELLSAVPEDVETLIVKLASREEFNRAGIDRPYMLNSLNFSAELRDGKPYIRVTSDKPVREPFLNFLIEIDWPKGHMMREYTILLDPPVFMEQGAPVQQDQMRPAAMESSRSPAAAPQSDSGFRPAVMGAAASTVPAMAAPVPTPGAQASQPRSMPAQTSTTYTRTYYQPPSGYRIQQGETLWSLADSMRPDQSVSIEQMMLAMLRSNPEAFINENVNGLKRGYILRIPDRDDIMTIDQSEAVALVREQNALWREYQQAVAGGEPASAMDREADGGEAAGLDESSDSRLEIVAAGSGTSASGAKDPTQMSSSELRSELAIARESLETERVEKEELQQRVESLEGQIDRMKSMLTLEDSDLAEMQQAVTPVEGEAVPEAELTEEVLDEEQAEAAIEELTSEDTSVVEDLTAGEEIPAEEAKVGEQDVFVDDEVTEVVEELVEQPAASDEEFSVSPTTEPAFMQPQKQGLLSTLLKKPALIAAAGGALLLVLLLIALIFKRRKSGGDEPLVASNLEDIADQIEDRDVAREVEDGQVEKEMAEAEAIAEAAAVGEELETESDEVLASAEDTVVSPPEAAAEEEPRDDVIAEADVYLAYGIYQQAEELLQNAIKENPDKDNYRVKLAETYFAGKNSDAFIELATDMNQRRNGEDTPAWQKLVAIGQQLVPGHDLFAGALADEFSMDDQASQTQETPEAMDTGLGSEEVEEAVAPDLDLAFDESEAGIVEDSADGSFEPAESVVFDLSETGADTAESELEESELDNVEFDLAETQSFEAAQDTGEFSLDLEASELGIEEETEVAESADSEFELDLSAEAEAVLGEADETEDEGHLLDDVDAGSLEFDNVAEEAEESEEAEVAAEAEESLDESTALDLTEEILQEPDVESEAESKLTQLESQPDSFEDDLDLSDLDDIDEVSTKLDLAKAYLDMGDADGTRSILDEVMSEGNDDQKREADDLLRQLG